MANISLTRRCRRGCGYCFAKHELTRTGVVDMPPEVYDRALSYLRASGIPEVRLLGGEPTEHPAFREYVTRAVEAGFRIVVFTGGLIPAPALEYLARMPAESLQVVLNTADPAFDPPGLVDAQERVCEALGGRIVPGVNIRHPDQDAGHCLLWIDRYGLQRTLRVGLAHPTVGGGNSWFRLPRRQVVGGLERLFEEASSRGIRVGFDCGFTPCMFSDEFVREHEELFCNAREWRDRGRPHDGPNGGHSARAMEASIGRCSAVIDILPEGSCIACYALSRVLRLPLPESGERAELLQKFESTLETLLPPGIYRDCSRCRYEAGGICDGGCRARRALRLRPDSSHLSKSVSVAGKRESMS